MALCVPDYHLKWLKALLASAILWVSSRRLTAAPRPLDASTNSAASFSLMLLPLRLRAAWTSQRTPSESRRSPRISTGTWYVAPPTRRGLTSMIGVALRSAASRTSTPGRRADASARASAWRRIRSDRLRLPLVMSLAVKREVVRLVGADWYLALRGMLIRRGIYLRPPLAAALAPYLLRPCFRSRTPAASRVPRMMWYLTDGRSFTRPPRTSTTECSWRLCPIPGMYAVTSIWLVRRTRAILRRAEFGFLGVIVRTCRQTPRFCGAPGIETWRWRRLFQFLRMAGALIFWILGFRPCRTSWLIVGTKTVPFSRMDGGG